MDKDTNKFDNESNEEVLNDEIKNEELENETLTESLVDDFTEDDEMQMKQLLEDGKRKNGKGNFFKKVVAEVIDETIALIVSIGLLYLIDLILRPFGYYINEKVPVYFIVFVIFNILYTPIMEATKLRKTIGNMVMKQ